MSLSRSQRLTWTTSGAPAGGGSDPDNRFSPAHHAGRAVPPSELDLLTIDPGDQPDAAKHPPNLSVVQVTVLGGERVDGRWDHPHPLWRQPFRDVPFPREDERIGLVEVAAQELPAPVGLGITLVPADVATPYDVRAGLVDAADEAGGLRIVQQHDVARPYLLREAGLVLVKDPRVVLVLGGTELGPGVHGAVQRVVNPLCDREELRVGVEHQPPGVDTRAAGVSEQRLQHLRDATAVGSGIDVPHDPAGQEGASPRSGRHEPLRPISGQQRAEHLERHSLDIDLSHRVMVAPTSGSRADPRGATRTRRRGC
jgi:hypothetical protein